MNPFYAGGMNQLFSLGVGLVYIVLAIMAALALHADATKRETLVLNLHPFFWSLSSIIFTPLLAVTVYWFVHYSQFGLDNTKK